MRFLNSNNGDEKPKDFVRIKHDKSQTEQYN